MDVDRARLDQSLVAPHTLQQAVARDDAVLVLNEVAEELELAPREADRGAIHRDGDRLEIGHQAFAAVAAVGPWPKAVRACPASQRGADASG